jgi:hypothetical protein
MTRVFIADLKQDVFLPFKVNGNISLYAAKDDC